MNHMLYLLLAFLRIALDDGVGTGQPGQFHELVHREFVVVEQLQVKIGGLELVQIFDA